MKVLTKLNDASSVSFVLNNELFACLTDKSLSIERIPLLKPKCEKKCIFEESDKKNS